VHGVESTVGRYAVRPGHWQCRRPTGTRGIGATVAQRRSIIPCALGRRYRRATLADRLADAGMSPRPLRRMNAMKGKRRRDGLCAWCGIITPMQCSFSCGTWFCNAACETADDVRHGHFCSDIKASHLRGEQHPATAPFSAYCRHGCGCQSRHRVNISAPEPLVRHAQHRCSFSARSTGAGRGECIGCGGVSRWPCGCTSQRRHRSSLPFRRGI